MVNLRTVIDMQPDLKILIIGLGQIGYSNAEYLAQNGVLADGYDINESAVQRALAAKVIKKQSTTFCGYDSYMICISTHDPKNISAPFFDGMIDVAKKLAIEGKEGAFVTIESTITKGLSKKLCNILQHKLHVAHVPHRYYGPEKNIHGVNQLRVLAGCKLCCAEAAQNFYNEILNVPTFTVSSTEIAELTKIIENTHRYLEIAFAEELKMFCDREGLDFWELRAAVNSKWNENVLEARNGIGGHCLPKDTKMYLELSKQVLHSSIMETAIHSNTLYEQHINDNQDFIMMPSTKRIQQERLY